ncbi:MAG: AAA family ATPase [Candidatus Thorarchaeota archaeon]|nr:AAA family ATPase [Candidatus Thorarchaeota archaeon]
MLVNRFTELESVMGVGPALAKRLREEHIPCAEVLAFLPPKRLLERVKAGEGTTLKVIQNTRALLGLDESLNGLERDEQLRQAQRLTSGIDTLDQMLMGGFETGAIVDFYGPARGGKSQLCHQLATTVQLPETRGGLDSGVIWLDSEGSFRPLTIRANAMRMGLDPEHVLSQIHVQRIINRNHLVESVWRLPELVHTENVSLIIVDSLGKFFRTDSESLGEHKCNMMDLEEILTILQGIATMMKCVVVVTNQVYEKIETYGGNPNTAVGGHLMAHAATYRFYIRRFNKDRRKISLEDHAGFPESEMEMQIGWGGLFSSDRERKAIGGVLSDYINSLGYPEKVEGESFC